MKFLFWLTLLPGLLIAQSKIDSLKADQKKSSKEKAAIFFANIGYEFLAARQYDSALAYYYKTIQSPINDKKLLASTMDCMGVAYKQKGFSDSSIYYYNSALKLYEGLKDTANAVTVNTNLSIVYKSSGQYEKGLESAFSAISVLEKMDAGRPLASGYNTVGDIYKVMKDFSNALIYYNKSLAIRMQIGFAKGVGQSYNNIGEMYLQMHQYDSAQKNLLLSMKIKREINDEDALGNTLNLLGKVCIDLKDLQHAEPYLLEALRIKKKSGERTDEIAILNNLGRLKLEQRDLKQAIIYLDQANLLIRQVAALEPLLENLELKVNLFKTLHQYPLAVKYSEELLLIRDSIFNKEKAESLIAMQTRYETEKKEQQINILKQDKSLQQAEIDTKRIWIQSLIITITLVTVIGLLLFYSYRSSQRNKKKVENLLKELHHRVKNNLQILSSVLSLQSQYVKDANAIQAIKSSESRVNSMALIHKKLYGDESNRSINMKEYISELSHYLLHTYGFTEERIQLNLNSEVINIDVDKAIPIGLILNELVSNALKYAYIDQKHPELKITLRHDRNGLMIQVSDNGLGISETTKSESSPSFGLKMVDILVKELKAKMNRTTSNGTAYILHVPMI